MKHDSWLCFLSSYVAVLLICQCSTNTFHLEIRLKRKWQFKDPQSRHMTSLSALSKSLVYLIENSRQLTLSDAASATPVCTLYISVFAPVTVTIGNEE